jgi:hypothetical protein
VKDVSQFEFEAEFDKEKAVSLANDIGTWLNKQGVGAVLWSMQPWQVIYKIATARDDISDIVLNLYLRKEVMYVELGVEPNTRILLVKIALSERWFMEEKKGGKARKQHPEAEGGAFA